ncbi:MAG: asparagine synthase (glutamine-hydrolyzing) [Myxococcota bacterium]
MCGIAGCLTDDLVAGETEVAAVVAAQRHRGPDHEAVVAYAARGAGGGAVLGHNRLSILDLDPRAHQTLAWDDGRYAITYNGEVYNFRALRDELEARGGRFRTDTDTEVVLAAYAEWGARAFNRFNGMFALAIWDGLKEELILARDRFGQKPLVYTRIGVGFAFASELNALLAVPRIRDGVHPSVEGMNHYFALGYTLAPTTLVDGVSKLHPASYATIRDGGRSFIERRYWRYDDAFRATATTATKEPEAVARELAARLEHAVTRRLVSDVPVGAFLSGGLDSSSVCTFAKRHLRYPLHTFSVGFDAASYDESRDARSVATALGTIHHEERLTEGEGRDLIDGAVDSFDPAFSDTSLVPMVAVSRVAAQHVKVVLTGDGADELLAGYVTYQADAYKRILDVMPAAWRRRASSAVMRVVPVSNRKTGWGFKARQFAGGLAGDATYGHYAWRELHPEAERIRLIGVEHEEQVRDTHPYRTFRGYYDEVRDLDSLDQHLYVDAKTWLADDVLVKVDRASMASSIEARAPFLDPDVAEYAAAIPAALKLRRGQGKWIFKVAMRPHLPPFTLAKRKAGFNAPINVWLDRRGEDEFRIFNRYVWDRACLRHPLLSTRAPR